MKKIILTKLKLIHFKGIKSLDIDFDQITNISGDNGTGKTTVLDAFLWLLFGKDSTGRTAFEIKPISMNGNGGPKDVEVEGSLSVGGRTITLKRGFKEKWVKKRGSENLEFMGHESTFYWNDVPVTQKEYQQKIENNIIPENVFRLITSPAYFSSLNWRDQRSILFDMAGDVDMEELAVENKRFAAILDQLSGKTLEEYKKQIAAERLKIKKELDFIPTRIDEVQRSIPQAQNWKSYEDTLKISEADLKKVESQLEDKSKAFEKEYQKREGLQKQIFEAKEKLNALVEKHTSEFRVKTREYQDHKADLEQSVPDLEIRIKSLQRHVDEDNVLLKANETQRAALREKYEEEQQKEFELPQGEMTCPTCQRPLDNADEKEQQLRESFNKAKTDRIETISNKGRALKASYGDIAHESSKLQERLNTEKQNLATVKEKLSQLAPPVAPDIEGVPGYGDAKKIISQLETEYQKPIEQPEVRELKEEKAVILGNIEEVKRMLATREQIEKGEERIAELEKQQKKLAAELVEKEGIEFGIQEFEKARVGAVEDKINGMFDLVKFQMFEAQVNGEIVPTCKATYNRVPYTDLNTAMRINAGLDIINAICKHREVSAPVFVDHAESVTVLHHPVGQLVRLIVSEPDKKLRVETIKS